MRSSRKGNVRARFFIPSASLLLTSWLSPAILELSPHESIANRELGRKRVHVTKAKMPLKLAGLLCLAAGFPALARAQEASTPLFRSRVAMVPISAVVRDARGRAVTTLKASDFEVRDNGEPRPILSFHTDNASPLTIAVL